MTQELNWKVHTTELFEEILSNKKVNAPFGIPLKVLREILSEIAMRAIDLNDPELHKLMIRLTLYSFADPKSKDYNPEMVEQIMGDDLKLATTQEEKQ